MILNKYKENTFFFFGNIFIKFLIFLTDCFQMKKFINKNKLKEKTQIYLFVFYFK